MTARICICDDDVVTGALLSLDLRAAGFEVDEPLTSVEAAVGCFAVSAPELLLLDLNMPGGGGLELLGYLQVRGLLATTRVVMLTSETDTYFLNRAKRLGAVGYLVKPVDSEHLASRVNRALVCRVFAETQRVQRLSRLRAAFSYEMPADAAGGKRQAKTIARGVGRRRRDARSDA